MLKAKGSIQDVILRFFFFFLATNSMKTGQVHQASRIAVLSLCDHRDGVS